jgi:hypothetical protein
VVYNIKIRSIDFSGYRADFDIVSSVTDKTEFIRAHVFESVTSQIKPGRDLESLITHAPPSCDVSQYATDGDPLIVKIPVVVTYSDKNGSKYMVRYVLYYDCWFEQGRMVRVGGIEKIK